MATGHYISSFPEDIDRVAFGHWLSGFTDGEGCFELKWIHNKRHDGVVHHVPSGRFEILLRQDDQEIQELIRSYWQCGNMAFRAGSATARPVSRMYFSSAADLWLTLVPHFEQFPLRAKKRTDFLVWKEGVSLLYRVVSRGTKQWTIDEKAAFDCLVQKLRNNRIFIPRNGASH